MARRAHLILINSVSSYVRIGLGFFLGLWITRTALNVLAQESLDAKQVFGVFILLVSTIGLSEFFTQSLQKAMIRFLSISIHEKNDNQTRRYFNSGWVANVVLSTGVAILIASLSPLILTHFEIPPALRSQVAVVIWIAASANVLKAISQPWIAAALAADLFMLEHFRGLVEQSLILLGVFCLPLIHLPALITLALVWFAPPVLTMALVAAGMAARQKNLRLNLRMVHWADCKPLFALSGWSSLLGFCGGLYERTDQILLNLLLGPVYNTFYAIVLQLENSVSRIAQVVTQVILPTASNLAHSGSAWEQQQLIIRTTRYVLSIALPFTISFSIFRYQIIQLWLGPGFEEAAYIVPLGMFLMLCRMPNLVTWPYLTAANRLKWPAIALLIDSVLNVGVSIFYVKALGLGMGGVILGTISTSLLRFFLFQGPYTARLLGLSPWQYWRRGFGRPLAGALWLTPLLWWVAAAVTDGRLLLLLLVAAAALYLLWLWFWVLDQYERNLFKNLISGGSPRAPKKPAVAQAQ